jgi:hypothetical protein
MDNWTGFGYDKAKVNKHLVVHDLTDDFNEFV